MIYPKRWLSCWKVGHRKASREFIDEELANALLKRVLDSDWKDQEAIDLLDYMHKFNSEYHKNVIKKGDPTAIHNSDKLRKDCYARENARNRDITSKFYKAQSPTDLPGHEVSTQKDPATNHHENTLIDLIDAKHKKPD